MKKEYWQRKKNTGENITYNIIINIKLTKYNVSTANALLQKTHCVDILSLINAQKLEK